MDTTQFERVRCTTGEEYIVCRARFVHSIEGRVLQGRVCDAKRGMVTDTQVRIYDTSIVDHQPVAWVDGAFVDSHEYKKWSEG